MSALSIRWWPLAVVPFLVVNHAPAVEAIWIGGSAGSWSEPANWSTGVAPNSSTTDVTIDGNAAQDSAVVLDQDATIQNLVLTAGDTLAVDATRVLVTNSATVAGTLNIGSYGRMDVSDFLWVQPGGTLVSTDGPSFRSLGNDTVLWNQGRIEGAKHLSSGFVYANEGVITANVPFADVGSMLVLTFQEGSTSRNTGSLLAEGGGLLGLRASSGSVSSLLDNTFGTIEARGDSIVYVEVPIRGGLLTTTAEEGTAAGTIVLSVATLEDVRLEGNVLFENVSLKGVIENKSVPVTAPTGMTRLTIAGATTLAGNGVINLNRGTISAANFPFGQVSSLTNGPDHTITGPGTINTSTSSAFVLDNEGLLEVDRETLQMTLPATGDWSNSGTMRARDGGTLYFSNFTSSPVPTLDNAGGVLEAGLDSTVRLGGMTVRGGTVRCVAPAEGAEGVAGKVVSWGGGQTVLEDLRLEGTIGEVGAQWRLAGRVENTGVLTGTQIYAEKDIVLTGGGKIEFGSQFTIPSGSSFSDRIVTNEDNLISGAGMLITERLVLTNRGIIQADVAGKTLNLTSDFVTPQNAVVNSGTLRAVNGGRLLLQASIRNYEGDKQGTILADDGSEVNVSTVTGGKLITTGTGRIHLNGALTDVQLAGSLNVPNIVGLAGRIQNDGTVSSMSAGFGTYFVGPVAELTGTGTWGSSTAIHSISVGGNYRAIVIHGPNHTIQGGGEILVNNGSLINQGTIIADGPSPLKLSLGPGANFSQEGMILVPAGETLNIETMDDRFTNRDTFDAVGDVYVKRLSAGAAELVNASGAYIGLRGSIHLDPTTGAPNPQAVLRNEAGATLAGTGAIDLVTMNFYHPGVLRNAGLMRLEGEDVELGRISLYGDFLQESTGTLEVTLAGLAPGQFDALTLNGYSATLAGLLDVHTIYDPAVGDEYAIIDTQGGTVSGVFDAVSVPALAGRWWAVDYLADKVVLSVEAITADFDGSGIVDYLDLDDWRVAYESGDDSADADGDGDSDGADFLAWQRQYGSGVPVVAGVSVPEPAGLSLFLGLILLRRIRK